MAPVLERPSRAEKLKSIVSFASTLSSSFAADNFETSLIQPLREHVDKAFTISDATAALADWHNLNDRGTSIWNQACKLNHSQKLEPELISLARVYACLLLDCAHRGSAASSPNGVRVFKVLVKTAKYCLDQGLLGLGEKVVERAADYDAKLTRYHNSIHIEQSLAFERLSCEYLMLRVKLAWRQDRLDLAKFMLAKFNPDSLDPTNVESLADLAFEIGKDQSNKAANNVALHWFEKAHDLIVTHGPATLSADAPDLKMSILYAIIKVLLKLGDEKARTRARNLLAGVKMEYGNRLVVLLLGLELLAVDPEFSVQEYSDTLQKVIRSVHITESNLKTIIYHIQKLKNKGSQVAFVTLKVLLAERLLDVASPQRIEKIIITAVWIATSSKDIPDPITGLREFLDLAVSQRGAPFGSDATHAAQMLMSKRIEASYRGETYDVADRWCDLALHRIFVSADPLNIGKLQRKQILCAVALSDMERGREIASSMTNANRNDPGTQYLLFKIALQSGDNELAVKHLDRICSTSRKDTTLLYACVLETQKMGHRALAIASLQQVLKSYSSKASLGVHLLALLRCTIRLLMQEAEATKLPTPTTQQEICRLFEEAIKQARTSKNTLDDDTFGLEELVWFSRNSYNLGVKYCAIWEPQAILRLIKVCLEFVGLYPDGLDDNLLHDLALRRLFCNFICISLLISLARNEDHTESQLQHYLDARSSATDFRKHLTSQTDRLHGGAEDDLKRKHISVLVFDIEAAARLKEWTGMAEVINECEGCNDLKVWGNLADIVLGCDAPEQVKTGALQQIIAYTSSLSPTSLPRVSRWIRCLYALALPSNTHLAEHLLNQVLAIIRPTISSVHSGRSEHADTAAAQRDPYPSEELEYLATTAYNQAIDFYCIREKDKSRTWAELAMRVADLLKDVDGGDGGTLVNLLQEKWSALRWEDEET